MINGLVQLLENLAVGLKQDREPYIPYNSCDTIYILVVTNVNVSNVSHWKSK